MSQGHEYEHDRFDDVPATRRVGAHRAPRGPYIGGLVVAVVAVLILVSAGVVGMAALNAGNQFHDTAAAASSGSSPAEASVTPEAPAEKITISVLNGTSTEDLASTVTRRLDKRGWTGVLSPASADSDTVKATHVYYAKKKLAGYAQGVADDLKSAVIVKTNKYDAFGAKLVVVLGADYVSATAK